MVAHQPDTVFLFIARHRLAAVSDLRGTDVAEDGRCVHHTYSTCTPCHIIDTFIEWELGIVFGFHQDIQAENTNVIK